MSRKTWVGIVLCLFLVSVIGCTGTQGIKIRGFVEDKKRVDQSLTEGNAGYVYGTPVPDASERKGSRKIYVLEVTKEAEQAEEPMGDYESISAEVPVYTPQPHRQKKMMVPPEPEFELPSFDDDVKEDAFGDLPLEEKAPNTFAVYTVQENDTLQKISKKFYDSYSKWPKIYEANRLKIKDPDQLKPGTVLKIPVE